MTVAHPWGAMQMIFNAGCSSWINKVSLPLQWQNVKMVPFDVVTSRFNVISNILQSSSNILVILVLVSTKNLDLWPGPIFWACAENSFRAQPDLSDLTLSMRRVTRSPWIAGFRPSQKSPSLVLTKRNAASGEENAIAEDRSRFESWKVPFSGHEVSVWFSQWKNHCSPSN